MRNCVVKFNVKNFEISHEGYVNEKKCSAHNHLACVTLSEYFNWTNTQNKFPISDGGW